MPLTGDFKAQLGRSENLGLLNQEARLAQIRPGRNSYVTGTALPGNSPVFFGRVQILREILSVLRRPDKPGCVSLLGERRIGKSSLLNQIYQALGQEPSLVSIHATAQNWNQTSQQNFFSQLQQAIARAIGYTIHDQAQDYPGFRDFILALAQNHDYQFVLILDEFEVMASNPNFNAIFFRNMRALGDESQYRFGYLVSSRRSLKKLCRDNKKIDESSFWNIFDPREIVGLLSEQEARDLVIKPFQCSLPLDKQPDLGQLWREHIKSLSGHHPALIQIVAARYWNARDGSYDPDLLGIVTDIREYLEDFWYQRGREELGILIRAVADRSPPPSPIATDLIRRGLLTTDRKPFSDLFKQIIIESIPKGKSLLEAVEDLEKGAERANKLFEQMVKLAKAAGKIYAAFKGNQESDS